MRRLGLPQVSRQELSERQVFIAQYMPKVTEASRAGELAYFFLVAQIDHIQAKRGSGWKQVVDLSSLAIPHRQDAHFEWYVAVESVVGNDVLVHLVCGDQLSHQTVFVDVNFMDQAINPIIFAQIDVYQRTKRWTFEL